MTSMTAENPSNLISNQLSQTFGIVDMQPIKEIMDERMPISLLLTGKHTFQNSLCPSDSLIPKCILLLKSSITLSSPNQSCLIHLHIHRLMAQFPQVCIQLNLLHLLIILYLSSKMSFFNKLFGGGDDKKATPPPPPTTKSEAEKIAEKKIKIEAALNDLDVKIKTFEEKEKKFDNKIEILKNKAKELIAADKKKDAKKYVEEATKVQKQAQSYTLRKKVLVDKKFQLEQAIMDMETIDALDTVGDHLKEQEKYSEKLQDIILDGEEAKMRQKEIDDKMRDMVGGESDEEEVDEMFNDLLNEVKKEKQVKIEGSKNVNVNVNVGPAQANKNSKKEVDDIEDMLANL